MGNHKVISNLVEASNKVTLITLQKTCPTLAFFMLCSKGLIAIIKQAIQEDIIKGLSLYKSVLKISHLLFLPMITYFFVVPKWVIFSLSMEFLTKKKKKKKASGQQINKDKTTLFFSKSNSIATKECC